MTQGIFLIQSDGNLVELAEEPYNSESLLQELLVKCPNLLSGNRPNAEQPDRWLLIKSEMGIPDGENFSDRWSLDHLFLDQNGIPTLVEVKRSTDTRIRREVVGQMLDYAANAIVYWPIEKITAEIGAVAVRRGIDPNILIQEFLGKDHDIVEFWQRVKTNLSSGRIRLIFVADEIPRELQRIVEFLNQQMSYAEVYAIEVKQYVGQGIKSLVPRIVGITAEAEIRKSTGTTTKKQWDEDSFLAILEGRSDPKEFMGAKQILDWAKSKNLRIAWGSGSSDSAFFAMMDQDNVTHYTFAVRTSSKSAYIQLQFAQLKKPFDSLEKRRELANKIQEAIGIKISDESIKKYPGIKLATLDQRKLHGFLAVFDWYIAQCQLPITQTSMGSS